MDRPLSFCRSGKGRHVTVYKTNRKGGLSGKKERPFSFTFSQEAKGVLQDLFSCYPPTDNEMSENQVRELSARTGDSGASRGDMFMRPAMTESEIADKVESVASRIEKSPKLRQVFLRLQFALRIGAIFAIYF